MRFGLNARTIGGVVKGIYITYLKEAEKIADFPCRDSCFEAILHLKNIELILICEIHGGIVLVNCENANINKVVNATTRQIEEGSIYIEDYGGMDASPDKLSDIAKIRWRIQKLV